VTLAIFLQQYLNALQWGSFYALIALGYTMVYGVLLLINFAHGDIVMVGAYLGFFVATFLVGQVALGLPSVLIFVLTVICSMILTAGLGVTIERIAYRPLRERGANRLYVVITALMVGLLLEYVNLATLGATRRLFPALLPKKIFNIDLGASLGGTVTFTNVKIMIIVLAILLMIGLEIVVRRTKVGIAMRAISYDNKFYGGVAVPLMGVPRNVIIASTFVIGSSLAAVAGCLFGTAYPVLSYNMGILIGWKAFIAAVVGGIGEIRGAMVGGYILGFVEIFVAAFFPSTYRDLIGFALLLVILSLRPTGIFGVAAREKV
jgi:branched-chain amino acid transport system permease protein